MLVFAVIFVAPTQKHWCLLIFDKSTAQKNIMSKKLTEPCCQKNNASKPVVNLIYCLTFQTVRLRLQFCFFFLVLLSRLASVWFQTGSFKRPASRVSKSFDLYIDRGVHQI